MTEQNKKSEKAFFEQAAKQGDYQRFDQRGYDRLLDEFERLVAPRPGELIVDMGCGTGAFTAQLHRRFPECRLSGVDFSEGCIARAKAENPGVVFKVADVEASGLAASSADVVCFSGMLHHFPELAKVAAEAYRVLRPGGRFFSFDPHHRNPAFWLYRAKSSPLRSEAGVTPDERLLTKEEVLGVFTTAGFRAEARLLSGVTFARVENRSNALVGIYNLLVRVAGRTPFTPKLGAWVIGSGRKP